MHRMIPIDGMAYINPALFTFNRLTVNRHILSNERPIADDPHNQRSNQEVIFDKFFLPESTEHKYITVSHLTQPCHRPHISSTVNWLFSSTLQTEFLEIVSRSLFGVYNQVLTLIVGKGFVTVTIFQD